MKVLVNPPSAITARMGGLGRLLSVLRFGCTARLLKELLELGKRLEQSLPTVKEIVETPIIKILAGEVIIALKKFVPYNYRPTVAVHHPHSMHDQISFVYQIVRGRPYCIALRVGNRFNSV